MMTVLASDPVIGPILIGMAVSTALSVGAGLLMASLNRQSKVSDNTPPTLTERGSPLPLLIGRRRIPGFLCWAGDRQTHTAGGGGKGLGGGGGGATTYAERGWHVLCVGPASGLFAIYENGKAIWTGNVTIDNSPSGTHIHTKQGNAYIYWGELDQPANSVLAAKLGTSSSWPCICYVFWDRKQLGGQKQWPQVEYEMEARIQDQVLTESVPWLDMSSAGTTGLTASFVTPTLDTSNSLAAVGIINQVVKVGSRVKVLGTDYTLDRGTGEIFFLSSGSIKSTDTVSVTFDSAGSNDEGPNPAHVLWQILTAPAPYGCAIPVDRFDGGAFEALGTLTAAEHQSCHVLASGGQSATDLLGQVLPDLGVMLPQVGGVLVPTAVRHVDAIDLPVVTEDMLVVPAPPAREQAHEGVLPDRLVFTIKDRTNNYRDMDVVLDDDGQAILRNRAKQQMVPIATVIDRRTALLVAKRREQELLTNTEKYTLEVAREARRLWPGQAFILDGYGQLRVASVEHAITRRTAKVEAVIDQYSGEPGTYVPGDIDDVFNGDPAAVANADLVVMVQELPAALSATPALAVLRVRADEQITGARVWVSGDGTSYVHVGNQEAPAAGGELVDAMPAGGPSILENGPVMVAYNSDVAQVADLSGNDAAWRTGQQLAVIGGEIFFLRNVTAVAGGWRLDGLIRARFDTDAEAHAAGDPVAIIAAADIRAIKTSLIRASTTLYVKTQPVAGGDDVDLSTVTAVVLAIASPRALRPLPPDNFVGNRGARINEYATGANVVFTWDYRVKDGQGRAVDEQNAGDAIGSGTPGRDGDFRIRIRANDLTLKRTIPVSDDTGTTTYTHANILADFGSEPASFIAELADVSGSYESVTRSITITKR